VLAFFFSNFALANADSAGKLVEKDSSFIMGRYIYVDGKSEIELHIDSLRRNEAWGNKDAYPCTIVSPIDLFEVNKRQDKYLYFAAKQRVFKKSTEEFENEGLWKQNGDTLFVTFDGYESKCLIRGSVLYDLIETYDVDSDEIYYIVSKYKYYLKVAD